MAMIQRISIAEIIPGTNISELLEIIREFKKLPIELGVRTADKFNRDSDEYKLMSEISAKLKNEHYNASPAIHANGDFLQSLIYNDGPDNHESIFRDFGTNGRALRRVILNLAPDMKDKYDAGKIDHLRLNLYRYPNYTRLALVRAPGTETMVEKSILNQQQAMNSSPLQVLHAPGDFNTYEGKTLWKQSMSLHDIYPQDQDIAQEWCGGINPDNVRPALDMLCHYVPNHIRIMARNGVITDKKTDLEKVYLYLNNAKLWLAR